MQTTETLYTVTQNGYNLTQPMSEYECQIWISHHQHLYLNLQVSEARQE